MLFHAQKQENKTLSIGPVKKFGYICDYGLFVEGSFHVILRNFQINFI